MDHHLIVKTPFGDYSRGDRISDPTTVANLLETSGEHLIRVYAPQDAPGDGRTLPIEGKPAG